MLITKTVSHGEYRAPNTVILTRAVTLTARALQKDQVSVEQITINADCTILVDFAVALPNKADIDRKAAITDAQSKLVRLGIPLTGQQIVPDHAEISAQTTKSARMRCHFYVEPQECWETITDMFHEIRVDRKTLCIDVETQQLERPTRLGLMPFINNRGCDQTVEEFLQNLYRRLPWHTHWLMKDAAYTVTPIAKQKKFSRVTFQPTTYWFGSVCAPACQHGAFADLLFGHALRPVLSAC